MLRYNNKQFIEGLPLTMWHAFMFIDSVNGCMHRYTDREKLYMKCHLWIQFFFFFFFEWANMIACDPVNISLVSHNMQNLQEHTQVEMTLL